MTMAVASMHDKTYAYLSPLTWDQNAVPYCERWGYERFLLDYPGDVPHGFAKIRFLKEICETRPDIEWIFWKDCDGLIMNFTIRIEDRTDPNYHCLLTTLGQSGINNGMMLIRNSPQGRDYLAMIYDHVHRPECRSHFLVEQKVMADTLDANRHLVKIVPQRQFNAGVYSDFSHGAITSLLDGLGTEGHWQPGDWIMHWPGEQHDQRLRVCQKYLAQVIL